MPPYQSALKLPVRTHHYPFEPVWSLLQRLAALNGYDSLVSFCNDFGLKFWDATTPSFVDILAALADVDPVPLLFASPTHNDGKDFRLGHEKVRWAGSSAILYKLRRVGVCPVCLANDRDNGVGRKDFRTYYRAWWSFPSLTNCPLHDVRMIHRSPADDTLLDQTCHDPRRSGGPNFDLSQVKPVAADASFERYVVGRLGFMQRTANDLLDLMSVHEVLNLVLRTGYTSLFGPRVSLKKQFSEEEVRDWNLLGWEILGTGEKGMVCFLDRLVQENVNTHGLANHASSFGRYYEWIYQEQKFGPTNYKAVADLIFDYTTSKFAILPSKAVFNRPVEAQSIFPLTKVAAMLRISLKHAGALVDHLDLRSGDSDDRLLLTQIHVDRMRSYLDSLVPATDLIERYALPRPTIRDLVEKVAILERAPALGTSGKRLFFSKTYLDAWWERIVGDAPTVDAVPEGAIPVYRSKQEMQVSASAVMKFLSDGVLACVGVLKDTPLFEAILISRASLQNITPVMEEAMPTTGNARTLSGPHRDALGASTRAGPLNDQAVEQRIGGRSTIRMPDESVARRLVDGSPKAMTVPAVVARAGIPKRHLVMLIANGWLRTRSGSSGVAYAKHRVGPEDLQTMLDALLDGAEEVAIPEPHQVDAETARQFGLCSLADVLRLVFERKVTWKGRIAGRHDYDALLLDVDEVRRLLHGDAALAGLTRQELRDEIPGMGQKSVQMFIDAGALRRRDGKGPCRRPEATGRDQGERRPVQGRIRRSRGTLPGMGHAP